jgi:hypothetical protein
MILEMTKSSLACLSSRQTEMRWAFWSSLSSLGTDFASSAFHVQIVRQNAFNGPVWQSSYLTNIVDSCLQSARIALQTFAMFSGVVLVDCHAERSSSSTEHLYNKKVFLWFMVLSLKVSCSVRWVSAAGFLKIETKFDAGSLLLKLSYQL